MLARRTTAIVIGCCVGLTLMAALACTSAKQPADPVAELRAGIATTVTDPARAAALAASVDELERLTQDIAALTKRQRETLVPQLRDYGASRATVEATLAELNRDGAALARKVLEAHLAFKRDTTPAEWSKLRKLEERALAQALAASLDRAPQGAEKG